MIISIEELNRLGDEQFERLIKALLIKVIGNGITPFSKGMDGAREAIFWGVADYPSKADQWFGHWIFQVKYSDISLGIEKARNQVKYLIDGEIKKVIKYGYLKNNKCDNYIFITNVPFTGQAQKGLHDYIQLKREEYGVKNFDYWDGEKISALLNVNLSVRETFFTIAGFKIISESELDFIKKVYVKPLQYAGLKRKLVSKGFVNIIGQPHVGKSILSKYLAYELKEELNLSNILVVQLIDHIADIHPIENCVIIFDDLFGDINYEKIGRKSKILNVLSKKNLVIVTSRDFIFEEAYSNNETQGLSSEMSSIIQEGAYSDEQLILILTNHLNYESINENISNRLFQYVERNASLIVSHLRFPHNIELFVKSIDENIFTKSILLERINSAKEILSIVRRWVQLQSEQNKRILLTLSLGRIIKIDTALSICRPQWNYSVEDILLCIENNKRLLVYDGAIKFNHPSFKTAIVQYFLESNTDTISNLVIDLITKKEFKESKRIYKSIIFEIVEKISEDKIRYLISNVTMKKSVPPYLWYCFIRRDRDAAISFLLEQFSKSRKHSFINGFVSSKDLMSNDETIDLIRSFFKVRSEDYVFYDALIVYFSFKIRERAEMFLEELDMQEMEDLNLVIRLLGAIGSKYPSKVFNRIVGFLQCEDKRVRLVALSSLNMLNVSYQHNVIDTLSRLLPLETDTDVLNKLKKSLNSTRRDFAKRNLNN